MKNFEEKAHQDSPVEARSRSISRLFRKTVPFISGMMIAIGTAMPACAFNMIATGKMGEGQAESDSGSVRRSASSAGIAIRTSDSGLFGELEVSNEVVKRAARMDCSPINITAHEIVVQQSVALMAAGDTLALGVLNFKLTGIYATATSGVDAGTKDYADMAAFEVTDTVTGEKSDYSVMYNEACRFVMNGKTYKVEVEGGDSNSNAYVRALRTENALSKEDISFETNMDDDSMIWALGAGYKTANGGIFAGGYLESIDRRVRNALMAGSSVVSAYDQEKETRLIGAKAKLQYKELLVGGAVDKEKLSADASFAQKRIGILADYLQERIEYGNVQWKSCIASASVLFRIIRDKEDFVDFGVRQGFEKYTVMADSAFVDEAGDIKTVSASQSFKSSPAGPIVKFRKGALEGDLAADTYHGKAVRPKVMLKYRW